MLQFPDSLNLSFHNLSIHQFSRKDLSLAQFIPRIYNKIIIKILGYFWGVTITAFIAGLGVQSKDLMFSISKNPQASMAEVLAKVEKYINGEEALISKKESSSTRKEKRATDKRRGRSPQRQATKKNPQEKIKNGPLKGGGTFEIVWVHRNPKDDGVTHLSVSLP